MSDGTKFRAVSETGVNYLYTGSLRWRIQDGTITPESFTVVGGRATFDGNGWQTHYYITDHLGSTRAVTNASGDVLATFDYTPYGELLAASDSTSTGTDYLFTGKENQAKQGVGELYDSQARFMDTGGRFLSIDPLAEVTCYSTVLTAIGHAQYRRSLYRVGRDKSRLSKVLPHLAIHLLRGRPREPGGPRGKEDKDYW